LELLFVLGRYAAGEDSRPRDLDPYLSERRGTIGGAGWMVCAFGRNETACLRAALDLGGKARIGFENNLFNSDGSLAHSNAERVADLVRTLEVNDAQ
jgi:uncharacterized protein (DUF849 family)